MSTRRYTETQRAPAADTDSPVGGLGPRGAMRSMLAGASYEEQVEMVRPRGSLPPLGGYEGGPLVQMSAEPDEAEEETERGIALHDPHHRPADPEWLTPGDYRFTERALATLPVAAGWLEEAGLLATTTLPQLAPSLDVLTEQRLERGADLARYRRLVEESTGFARGRYQRGLTFCQRTHGQLRQHEQEQLELFQSYNNWANLANAWNGSMARLMAMREMYGFESSDDLAVVLEEELESARALCDFARPRGQEQGVGDALGAVEAAASGGKSVESELATVNDCLREADAAYLGFRGAALALEARDLRAEGADERARLTEIERIKATVREVGATVDGTMGHLRAAPATLANLGTAATHAERYVAARANLREMLDGQDPAAFNHLVLGVGRNSTYLAEDARGGLRLRDVMLALEEPAEGGVASSYKAPGIRIPTSVGDLAELATEFAYAGEIRALKDELARLDGELAAIAHLREALEIQAAIAAFRNTLSALDAAGADLQNAVHSRRNQYRLLGARLDDLVVALEDDRDFDEGRLGLTRSQERYTAALTLTGCVREALLTGRCARDAAESAELTPETVLDRGRRLQAERTAEPPRSDLRRFDLGVAEADAIQELYERAFLFLSIEAEESTPFARVEALAQRLIAELGETGRY